MTVTIPAPSPPAADLDVEALDAAVEAAIRRGGPEDLRILGYGEITLVLGWPTEHPTHAVKRLPAFADARRAGRYKDLLCAWRAAVRDRGVDVLETRTAAIRDGAAVRLYLVQPLQPREALLNHVLRSAGDGDGTRRLAEVVEAVCAAVDERVGLDAQAANWVVGPEGLCNLDVSTPLMRDAAGRDLLDLGLFLSIYPWSLRPALGRIAHGVMAQFHDPRGVLLDTASQLVKERLERWLPVLLDLAAERLERPITEAEVRAYFARDRRLWLAMQRLRRADRAWQRRVRRRPYPFLLAPPYAYGPPENPEESR